MRKIYGVMAILAVVLLSACGSDDDGGITDEQRQLIMGQSEGSNLFHTGLPQPLRLARDDVHSNVREFDLNNDGDTDIVLRAFQDFNGNKGLTISTMNSGVRISLDRGLPKALETGDVVTITSETWGSADALPLAVSEGGTTSGTWNMQGRRFVAIRFDIGISRFLAWIELSVEDFDNYSFYNYAFRAVP